MKTEKAKKVFISYSHKDEKLQGRLLTHLKALEREDYLVSWHDRKITPGDEWREQIHKHLADADIILLLVSADFLASDYCYDIEMTRALERHEAKEARVIPIILKPVDWQGAPFSKLQVLPKDAKPVTKWPNRDDAFLNVTHGVRAVIEEISGLTKPHSQSMGLVNLLKQQSMTLFQRLENFREQIVREQSAGKTLSFSTTPNFVHIYGVWENLDNLLPKEMEAPLSLFELFALLFSTYIHPCRNNRFPFLHEKNKGLTSIEIYQNSKEKFSSHQDSLGLSNNENRVLCEICVSQTMPDLSHLNDLKASLKGYGKVRIQFLAAILRLADIFDLCIDKGSGVASDEYKKKAGIYRQISDVKIKPLPSWDIEIFAFSNSVKDHKELVNLQNALQKELDGIYPVLKSNGLFYKKVELQVQRDYYFKSISKGRNPFIKLDAFSSRNAKYFAGRDTEINQMIQKISAHNLVVLIGQSGVGKTSLIKAGVLPLIRKFGYDVVEFSFQEDPIMDIVAKLQANQDDLGEPSLNSPFLLKIIQKRLQKRKKPLVLIGDHLEQMFTIEKSDRIKQIFINQLLYILSSNDSKKRVSFLFSIREDYLPDLLNLSQDIPDVYDRQKTFRLHRLDKSNGIEVLKRASELSTITLPDDLIIKIVGDLCYEGQGLIYPPYLQIVGFRLYAAIERSIGRGVSQDLDEALSIYESLGGVSNIVNEYFEGLLDRYETEDKPFVAKILNKMVTEHHTKKRVRFEELLDEVEGPDKLQFVLDRLIKQRIVRNTLGDYELIHDFIAERIVALVRETTFLSLPVRKALVFIEKEYSNQKLSVKRIASAAHISPNHLNSLFRKQLRRSIKEQLSYYRIAKAKELLEFSLEPISSIASSTGFSSVQSFSRKFKIIVKNSPRKYRKSKIDDTIRKG